MSATAEKTTRAALPDDFPSAYEHQVNENLRRFAQAAEARHEFYPTEHGMPRKKDFNRRRFQIIICAILILVATATVLAAVGTSTGFLSSTETSRSPPPLSAENVSNPVPTTSTALPVGPHQTHASLSAVLGSSLTSSSTSSGPSISTTSATVVQDAETTQVMFSTTGQGLLPGPATTFSTMTGPTSVQLSLGMSQSVAATVKSTRVGFCGLPGMGCGW